MSQNTLGVDTKGVKMRSLIAAVSILEKVGELGDSGVSEIARSVGLPKTTSQRMLKTWEGLGWVRQDSRSFGWALTSKALTLGLQHRLTPLLREIAHPTMQNLSTETGGETIHLTVLEGRMVTLVDKIDGTRPVRTHLSIGVAGPVHLTASGVAILAALPAHVSRELLESHALETSADNKAIELESILASLPKIQQDGYATVVRTRDSETAAAAAPVFDSTGTPVAAISISLPAHRFPESLWPDYGSKVRKAAAACTDRLRRENGLRTGRTP